MSIIIKGEPMPEACALCTCFRDDSIDGVHAYQCKATFITYGKEDDWIWNTRPNWCPLVELPETHGRLIDADKLFEEMRCANWEVSYFFDGTFLNISEFANIIQNIVTVIEAEGETPYRTRYEVGEEHPVAYEIEAEDEG